MMDPLSYPRSTQCSTTGVTKAVVCMYCPRLTPLLMINDNDYYYYSYGNVHNKDEIKLFCRKTKNNNNK